MGAKIILKKLFSLSLARLGKVWSFWKVEPTRPNSGLTAKIVSAIMNPGDRVPQCYVFALSDGRFFIGDVGASCELDTKRVEQLHDPHPDITHTPDSSRRHSNVQPVSKLGLSSGFPVHVTDPAILKALVTVYYGAKAPEKLVALSLA
jgi:hypothetical protein